MRSILFVDDDKRLLQGLRRLLSDQRSQWEMTFASGGEQARGLLELAEFDVLVTDLRMPGLDGVDVLGSALEHQPLAARLLLSGVGDDDRRWLAEGFVQRVLAKPCDGERIRLELHTAVGMRERLLELADPCLERIWSCPPGLDADVLAVCVAASRAEGLPDAFVRRLDEGGLPRFAEALRLAWPELDAGSMSAYELAGRVGARPLLQVALALSFVELVEPDAPDWDAALASAEGLAGLARERGGGDVGADALVAGLIAPSCAVGGGQAGLDVLAWALAPWGFAQPVLDAVTGVGVLGRAAGASRQA